MKIAKLAPVARVKYTQEQLQEAFTQVQSVNWKDPIDKILPRAVVNEDLIIEAVIHFTGSVPSFTEVCRGKIRIRAAGYYLTIGA